MDRDVALRQHRDAGDAARLEVMQMDMQKRRARGFDAAPQRRLDMLDVVEPLGAVQIDDQVHAGAAHAVANGKVVFGQFLGQRGVGNILALKTRNRTLVRRRDATFSLVFLSSFRAVPGIPKPFTDRKRAFWLMPSSPTR